MGVYGDSEAAAAAPPPSSSVAAPPRHSDESCSKVVGFCSLFLRIAAVVISILVIAVMKHAEQKVFFLEAKWEHSKAFVALVAISSICLGYSSIQSIVTILQLCTSSCKSPSKFWDWTKFIADQILTYAMLGAAGAAAELAYIAKNGSSRANWRPICSTFNTFCNRAGASIILSFIAVLVLANSSVISAYHLFRRKSL